MAAASWPCPMALTFCPIAETRVSLFGPVVSVVDTDTRAGENEPVAVIRDGCGPVKAGPGPCPPIYCVTVGSQVRLEMILQASGELRSFRPIGLAAPLDG